MAKVKFAFKLYELQQEIIDYLDGKILNKNGERYRFLSVAIGRQSGKSFLAKVTILDHAINQNHRCMWVAPTIPTARQHWNELVNLVTKAGVPTTRISQAAKEISFEGGGFISIRSAVEPDTLRGATLDLVILDEAAFYRNGEYLFYSVILPMVSASRGNILLLSTPNGRNYFWRIWKLGQGNDEYHKSWRASSYASPYQDKKLLDRLKETMPEYQWLEEFMAEFLADSGGVFTGSDAAAKVKFMHQPDPKASYVAGIDFGFNHDATCFTVIDKVTREQVYAKRFFSRGTASTIKILTELINLWQPDITHVERNGLGAPFFNLLKDSINGKPIHEYDDMNFDEEEDIEKVFETNWHGKVRAVFMDNTLKRKMVETLAADIEYGRLKILSDDCEYGDIQISEMSTYLRERSNDGMLVKYGAEDGAMDDTVSCLYLANYGMPRPNRVIVNKQTLAKNPFKGGGKHLTGGRDRKRGVR